MRHLRRCMPFCRLAVGSFSGRIAFPVVPAYQKTVFHPAKYGFPRCMVHFICARGNFRRACIGFTQRRENGANSHFLRSVVREFSMERPVLWHAKPRRRARRLYRATDTRCPIRKIRMEYFQNSRNLICPIRAMVRVRYNLKSLDCIFKLNFLDSHFPVAKAQTEWFFRDIGRAGNKIPVRIGSQCKAPV